MIANTTADTFLDRLESERVSGMERHFDNATTLIARMAGGRPLTPAERVRMAAEMDYAGLAVDEARADLADAVTTNHAAGEAQPSGRSVCGDGPRCHRSAAGVWRVGRTTSTP